MRTSGRRRRSRIADVDRVTRIIRRTWPSSGGTQRVALDSVTPRAVTADAAPVLCAVAAASTNAGEQRMRPRRLRLELGMELHGEVPRMAGQLGDLDELAVGRSARDPQAVLGERPLVQAVELVAVAMALVDQRRRRRRAAPASRARARRRSCRAASCRRDRRRRADRAACRSPWSACPASHSVESASARPATLRAYSTVAHWKP